MTLRQSTLHSAATAAADGVIFDTDGYSAVICQITGTFVGTITFKGTIDKSTWVAIQGYNMNDGKVRTTATAAGLYYIECLGISQFIADITSYTEGSITVTANALPEALRPSSISIFAPNTYATGELAGSATAVQMPDVACKWVVFKAQVDNAGDVFIGTSSSVTVCGGTTDITSGFQLDAGDETPMLPCTNLNIFYRITDNAGDDLSYIAGV